jgi:hypothetical protein
MNVSPLVSYGFKQAFCTDFKGCTYGEFVELWMVGKSHSPRRETFLT